MDDSAKAMVIEGVSGISPHCNPDEENHHSLTEYFRKAEEEHDKEMAAQIATTINISTMEEEELEAQTVKEHENEHSRETATQSSNTRGTEIEYQESQTDENDGHELK
jgi:hypothetical protein